MSVALLSVNVSVCKVESLMREKSILIVEDDLEFASLAASFLQREGYRVEHISNGALACEILQRQRFDLVILDYMLPGADGVEICQSLRAQTDVPVLMMTAKDDDLSELKALRTGVDNYLKKPLRPHILLAHVEALLRRSSTGAQTQLTGLRLDDTSLSAQLDGTALELTSGEFELLNYFYQRAGQVISRDQLYLDIRGIEYDGIDRSIDLRISVLRKKMGDVSPPYRYLKTVRARGYLLALN